MRVLETILEYIGIFLGHHSDHQPLGMTLKDGIDVGLLKLRVIVDVSLVTWTKCQS